MTSPVVDQTVSGLSVSGLSVSGPDGTIVQPLALDVEPGRTLAIIGESGSGKTMTARAMTGLLPRGTHAQGRMHIDGAETDLSRTDDATWERVRGRQAVLLLQDPFTSLSPVIRCGEQIGATLLARARSRDPESGRRRSTGVDRTALRAEIARRLDEVRLPASVARSFPSELSGGMRQRVAIAAALAAEPRLLIADEPTTALDASTQGEVLDLLRELQAAHRMSLILISHDLGVVAGRSDELIVMRSGEVVERGNARSVLVDPQHGYTRALLEANPTVRESASAQETSSARERVTVLEASGISKHFGRLQALNDTGITVGAGEIVAIVGESGSGKSTFARCLAGLEIPDAGTMTLDGAPLPAERKGRTPGQLQVVFQDPYSTLNPSFTVDQALAEAIRAAGGSAASTLSVEDLLRLVELDPELAGRRPSQLSGGQRQRVAIARALAPNPRVLICDESVSALDVSVQAQILELLTRFSTELGLAIVFITHDLGVVARIAHRAIVLRRGEIVESGTTQQILETPQHEYTKVLVAAARRDSMVAAHEDET